MTISLRFVGNFGNDSGTTGELSEKSLRSRISKRWGPLGTNSKCLERWRGRRESIESMYNWWWCSDELSWLAMPESNDSSRLKNNKKSISWEMRLRSIERASEWRGNVWQWCPRHNERTTTVESSEEHRLFHFRDEALKLGQHSNNKWWQLELTFPCLPAYKDLQHVWLLLCPSICSALGWSCGHFRYFHLN